MLWDIGNTLLEFLTIYLLFTTFAHIKLINRHLCVFVPIAIGLSVFFCLDIPHFIIEPNPAYGRDSLSIIF